jgi:hypothetical protein
VAFAEDFNAFFEAGGFAVSATLGGVAVRGIFDGAYAVQDLGGEVAGSTPAFTLPSASVPANPVGLALVVGGATYKVVEPIPDGTGVTTLRLRS